MWSEQTVSRYIKKLSCLNFNQPSVRNELKLMSDFIIQHLSYFSRHFFSKDDDTAITNLMEEMIETISNDNPQRKVDKLGRSHIDIKRTGPLVVCIRNAMFQSL